MLSFFEIKNILKGKNAEYSPSDDFRVLDSYAIYEEGHGEKALERRLEYLCYEIESINPETGEKLHFYKALKFVRIIRLPKSAKQSTSLMDMHQDVLTSVYQNGYNLVTIIANVIHPVPIGLLYLYGVQGVGNTIDEAKAKASENFTGFIAAMQGTYRVLEMRIINAQETEWLREKMYNMEYMTAIRGIPEANATGEDMGNKGIGGKNLNPDSQGTLEEFIAGMMDYEYVLQILTTPVFHSTLRDWHHQTAKHMTDWNSQLQGTKALSFNLSMPMMMMAQQSSSQGWSKAYTDADTVSSSVGESFSMGYGESVSESISRSYNESFGINQSQSVTESNSVSQSISNSQTFGQSFGQTFGQTEGQTFGQTVGQTVGQTYGETFGQTVGQTVGQSANTGVNISQSNSISHGQGINSSNSSNYTESQGISNGQSYGQNYSEGYNSSHSIGTNQSFGQSFSESIGSSESASVSQNASSGISASQGNSWNNSTSVSTSTSEGSNYSNGVSSNDGWSENQSFSSGFGYNSSESASLGANASANIFGIGGSVNGSSSVAAGDNASASAGVGSSENHSYGASFSEGYNASISDTNGASAGIGGNSSVSSNSSISNGSSYGETINHSQSINESNSFGASESYSSGLNYSNGQSFGVSESVSNSQSISNGISNGWSENISNSTGISQGQSYSQGINISDSLSDSHSISGSNSLGISNSNSLSNSLSTSASNSISNSQSVSQSVSNGVTHGTSVGSSQGQSYSQGVSSGTSNGYSTSQNVSQGSNLSKSVGESQSVSNGTSGAAMSGMSSTMGFGPSIGYNKSYQWLDQQVKDILEMLEYKNERIKKALRGEGAFYTYVYIVCPSRDALAAAQAVAKSTWQNEFALIQPLQVLKLSNEEQKHLLYHFSAFSNDITRENIAGEMQYKYCTALLPHELVAYTHLPRISAGGVFADVNDIPKFAVPSMLKGEIYMGTILSAETYSILNGYRTPFDYRIDESELMHGFFTGASRSGKTVAAMRFVAELANVRRKDTGKRLRIVCMDPKQDWRTLARFVDPERFRFYSLGNASFRPVYINPFKIPRGVVPQTWIDGIIDIYCRAYGLLERGKQMLGETIYTLYKEAGVFKACESDNWQDVVPKLSAYVTFPKVYLKMLEIKVSLEDPTNSKGRAGNDTRDAYARLIDRLQCFAPDRNFSIEYKLFGTEKGLGIDELIGDDDVTILESSGLEKTFKNFIFGVITSGFYKYAKAHEGGYLAKDQYETVLVIEEANEVLIGNDCAGSGSGSSMGMTVSGQSEFEEILDQSAGYGLFIIAITQKIADMPKSIIANSGLVFAGRLKTSDDITVVVRSVAREERYDDRDLVKWFPRMATGMFVCQRSRTFDFKDAEPILVQVARLNAVPPSNLEIEEILTQQRALAQTTDRRNSA